MFEFPQTMDRNNYCTLCAECVKGCSRDNLALRFRAFGKDLWASGRRVLDESYLAVVLVGLTLLVTAQMLTGWPDWTEAVARWLPDGVRGSLKPVTYLGFVESSLLLGGSLVVVPLLVLGGAAVANRLAGESGLGLRRTFVLFGYMFIPVGLGMHLAHNLAHLLLEGGGIVPAVQRARRALHAVLPRRARLAGRHRRPSRWSGLLQMAVLVGFFVLSLVAGHRLSLRRVPGPADRRPGPRSRWRCCRCVHRGRHRAAEPAHGNASRDVTGSRHASPRGEEQYQKGVEDEALADEVDDPGARRGAGNRHGARRGAYRGPAEEPARRPRRSPPRRRWTATMDATWKKAPPLTVKAVGGKNLPGGSTEVTLRAVYAADTVYFLDAVQGPDRQRPARAVAEAGRRLLEAAQGPQRQGRGQQPLLRGQAGDHLEHQLAGLRAEGLHGGLPHR